MVGIKLQKEENRKAFLEVFPNLAEVVLEELRKYNMPEDAYEWTKRVCAMSWGDDHLDIPGRTQFLLEPRVQCSWR